MRSAFSSDLFFGPFFLWAGGFLPRLWAKKKYIGDFFMIFLSLRGILFFLALLGWYLTKCIFRFCGAFDGAALFHDRS